MLSCRAVQSYRAPLSAARKVQEERDSEETAAGVSGVAERELTAANAPAGEEYGPTHAVELHHLHHTLINTCHT